MRSPPHPQSKVLSAVCRRRGGGEAQIALLRRWAHDRSLAGEARSAGDAQRQQHHASHYAADPHCEALRKLTACGHGQGFRTHHTTFAVLTPPRRLLERFNDHSRAQESRVRALVGQTGQRVIAETAAHNTGCRPQHCTWSRRAACPALATVPRPQVSQGRALSPPTCGHLGASKQYKHDAPEEISCQVARDPWRSAARCSAALPLQQAYASSDRLHLLYDFIWIHSSCAAR